MSWTQSAKRRGSKDEREIQIQAKRDMPEWRTIIPGIIRAIEKWKKQKTGP